MAFNKKKFFRNQVQGASAIEYVVLIVIFLGAILVMQKQIGRAIMGRWKDLGDSISTEQYEPVVLPNDPTATVECGRWFDPNYPQSEQWYREDCYQYCMANPTPGGPGFTCNVNCSGSWWWNQPRRNCCIGCCLATGGVCNF